MAVQKKLFIAVTLAFTLDAVLAFGSEAGASMPAAPVAPTQSAQCRALDARYDALISSLGEPTSGRDACGSSEGRLSAWYECMTEHSRRSKAYLAQNSELSRSRRKAVSQCDADVRAHKAATRRAAGRDVGAGGAWPSGNLQDRLSADIEGQGTGSVRSLMVSVAERLSGSRAVHGALARGVRATPIRRANQLVSIAEDITRQVQDTYLAELRAGLRKSDPDAGRQKVNGSPWNFDAPSTPTGNTNAENASLLRSLDALNRAYDRQTQDEATRGAASSNAMAAARQARAERQAREAAAARERSRQRAIAAAERDRQWARERERRRMRALEAERNRRLEAARQRAAQRPITGLGATPSTRGYNPSRNALSTLSDSLTRQSIDAYRRATSRNATSGGSRSNRCAGVRGTCATKD